MLKRFLVFKGDEYYPSAGMGDFVGDFDSFEEAQNAVLKHAPGRYEWALVWDSENRCDAWKS